MEKWYDMMEGTGKCYCCYGGFFPLGGKRAVVEGEV